MKIETLDHVALWVSDRDRLADFLTEHVGMHVIERTDKFTIVGSEARRGKLTLFVVPDRREAPPLGRIFLRVPDLDAAAGQLPADAGAESADGRVLFTAPEGLPLGFVEADGIDYDLHHVVLNATDPERQLSASSPALGFTQKDGKLWVGDSYIEVEEGPIGDPEPLAAEPPRAAGRLRIRPHRRGAPSASSRSPTSSTLPTPTRSSSGGPSA